jgi:hypothetical protein
MGLLLELRNARNFVQGATMQNKKEVHMVYPCPFCGEIPNQPDDWLTVSCRTKRCPMRAKPVKLNNWNKQHCRQINPNQRVAPQNTAELAATDSQQLKAEIATLATELQDFNDRRVSAYGRVTEIVAKMRHTAGCTLAGVAPTTEQSTPRCVSCGSNDLQHAYCKECGITQ